MGYSVRVTDWRYTVWLAFNGTANRGVWGEGDAPPEVFYEELYSHKGDDGTGLYGLRGEGCGDADGDAWRKDGLRDGLKIWIAYVSEV